MKQLQHSRRLRLWWLILVSMLLPLQSMAQFSGSGQGTQNDPYLILNPLHLNQVRNFLNQSDVYFSLGCDIDMSSYIASNFPTDGWLPIGNAATPFKGVFLGNGHKITGISCARNIDYVGFFGRTVGATIQGLTLEVNMAGNKYVGGLVGSADTSIITGINISGSVKGSGKYVGGLAGHTTDTAPKVCHFNDGTISGIDYVGGMIGEMFFVEKQFDKVWSIDDVTSSKLEVSGSTFVGGLIGNLKIGNTTINFSSAKDITSKVSVNLNSCFADASINSQSTTGGLIGQVENFGQSKYYSYYRTYWYFNASTTITNCSANSTIDCKNGTLGGLIGDIKSANDTYNTVTLDNLFALGRLNSNGDAVGGLIGKTESLTRLYNSYYNGDIVSSGSDIGGIIGSALNTTVLKCYSSASVNGSANVGGLVGTLNGGNVIKSSACLCSVVNAAQENGGRIWGLLSGSNTWGISATAESNKGLVTTVVSVGGNIIVCNADQHGDDYGEEVMKMRATYQGLGWNFTNDWTIQETNSFPYKLYQTVPPIISTLPETGSMVLRGKCANGGEVFVTLNGKKFNAECDNSNNWMIRFEEPLKAGEIINVYAIEKGKQPSFSVNVRVSFMGEGTEENPYQIYTVSDLMNVNEKAYYRLMNDLDLSDIDSWTPIGRNGGAMCHLDGDSHVISGMNVKSDMACNGLFATLINGSIKNLIIKDATVNGGNATALLVGRMSNSSISNVQVEGTVTGGALTGGMAGEAISSTISNVRVIANVTGGKNVGGIAGRQSKTNVSLCVVKGDIVGADAVGGITSEIDANSSITKCFTSGSVKATGNDAKAGGIVGINNSTITDCYSTSYIESEQYAGGIAGLNKKDVTKCYASGNIKSVKFAGGIVGYNDGTSANVTACVAANEYIEMTAESPIAMRVIGGIRNGAALPESNDNYALEQMIISVNGVKQQVYDDPLNGVALTTAQVKSQSQYTDMGWDFNKTWKMDSTSGMPFIIELGPTEGGSILPDNFLTMETVYTEAGKQIEMLVNLENRDELSGVQFDISLPEGVTIATKNNRPQILAGSRINTARHTIGSRMGGNNMMRVLVMPRGGAEVTPLPGNTGDIVKITFDIDPNLVNGEYEVELKFIFFSSMESQSITGKNCKGKIVVKNDFMSSDDAEGQAGTNAVIIVNMDNKVTTKK